MATSKAREPAGIATESDAEDYTKILEAHSPFPNGVASVDFRLGRDSDGESAVWIVLTIAKDDNPSKDKIDAITKFSNALRDDILNLGSNRWPYVQLRDK